MSFSIVVHCDVVMDSYGSTCARRNTFPLAALGEVVNAARALGWSFGPGARCPVHSITLAPQAPRAVPKPAPPAILPDNVLKFRPRPS